MWIFKKNLDSDPFMYFPGFFSKLLKLQPRMVELGKKSPQKMLT